MPAIAQQRFRTEIGHLGELTVEIFKTHGVEAEKFEASERTCQMLKAYVDRISDLVVEAESAAQSGKVIPKKRGQSLAPKARS